MVDRNYFPQEIWAEIGYLNIVAGIAEDTLAFITCHLVNPEDPSLASIAAYEGSVDRQISLCRDVVKYLAAENGIRDDVTQPVYDALIRIKQAADRRNAIVHGTIREDPILGPVFFKDPKRPFEIKLNKLHELVTEFQDLAETVLSHAFNRFQASLELAQVARHSK